MKMWLIYTFILASGQTLDAVRPAVDDGYRPVRNAQRCEQLAAEQAERMRAVFARGNGIFQDVVIDCRRKKP